MLHVYKIDKEAIRRIEDYCNMCAEKRAKARKEFRINVFSGLNPGDFSCESLTFQADT